MKESQALQRSGTNAQVDQTPSTHPLLFSRGSRISRSASLHGFSTREIRGPDSGGPPPRC